MLLNSIARLRLCISGCQPDDVYPNSISGEILLAAALEWNKKSLPLS